MKDRISLHPGRVRLVPVPGQEHTYDLVRADEPTQEGTALNKETLLKDATAALYGLGDEATPDEVLVDIAASLDTAITEASDKVLFNNAKISQLKIAAGSIGNSTNQSNTMVVDISPYGFTAVPSVMLAKRGDDYGGSSVYKVTTKSTKAFTIETSYRGINAYWLAVGY